MLAVSGVLFLGGCADKLTRSRFEMIEVHVSDKDDVARTLGDPSRQLDDQWHYERVDKHLNVIIEFDDGGVVIRKQWIDAMAEEWEDTEKDTGDGDSYESTKIRDITD
jgi:hypothetical protein